MMTPWIRMLPIEMKLCCRMLGTATTAIFLKRNQEKIFGVSSVWMVRNRRNTTTTASMQLTPWHRKVAQATPATPIWKAVTKRISTAMLLRDEAARK